MKNSQMYYLALIILISGNADKLTKIAIGVSILICGIVSIYFEYQEVKAKYEKLSANAQATPSDNDCK